MARLVDFSDLPSWFVVLPDCESASTVAASLRGPLVQEIKHPSGRPWLLGRWPEGAVTVGKTAQTKVAVMGQHAVTAGELTEVAGRISTTSGLDHLGSSLVGSSHLVASVRGTVRVQGSLNSMRRVYHAEIARVTVASDRSDVLACLLDAPLDVQRLAVHLLDPLVLHPVTDHPLWQGVRALEQDHYLVLDHAGGQRAVKWWAPPEPTVPMA